jgi:hypothetical protein
MRAIFNGSAFAVSYNLTNINLLIIPAVMLRNRSSAEQRQSRGSWQASPDSASICQGSAIAGDLLRLFLALWKILVGLKLLQLGRSTPASA